MQKKKKTNNEINKMSKSMVFDYFATTKGRQGGRKEGPFLSFRNLEIRVSHAHGISCGRSQFHH